MRDSGTIDHNGRFIPRHTINALQQPAQVGTGNATNRRSNRSLNDSTSETYGAPSVTIVIVTYRSAHLLQDLFESLPAALDGIPHYEIVVVDNASDDDTLKLVKSLSPDAKVVSRELNGGYAAGVNEGIHASEATDALLILNPDVRLLPGCVAALLERLRYPGVGIAVPRLLGEDGRCTHSLHRTPTILRAWGEAFLGGNIAGHLPMLGETITDERAYCRPTTAAWATGAVMMISMQCIRTVGEWNESFFLYSEETEYCLRASDAGFKIQLEPHAEVIHIGGELTSSPRLWAMQAWNRVRLYRSRHGHFPSAAFHGGVIVNEALRAALGRKIHWAGLASVLSPSARPTEVRGKLNLMPRPESQPSYVCFSAQDFWYHNRAHSDIQLMRHVAASRHVLFVNSIAMRMPMPGRSTRPLRRILRKAKSMAMFVRKPIADLPYFHVMTPVTLPLYGSSFARRLNATLVRAQVIAVSRWLGIKNPVLIITIPTAWDVVRTMVRRSLVYNRSDLHSSFPEADKMLIEGLEAQLLRHSDIICYVSRALMQQELPITKERAIFLDHGVDLDHFQALPYQDQPVDIRDLPRPRIGFFGGFEEYTIDFDLLERIAAEFPEASLVLVGDATCSMERFRKFPNVYWLGYRPYESIPGYGSAFDVAIMPKPVSNWIHHSNPIKLKEYLALGLPVVTTDFPEAHYYSEHLAIARDADDFVAKLRRLLSTPPKPTIQRSAVLTASWAHTAKLLIDLCEGRVKTANMDDR